MEQVRECFAGEPGFGSLMAALIDAIDVKRKSLFEFENTPYACLDAEVNTPTARGGQTLVRLKMRNLLTNAVFEKTFKASDKFKEPDLELVRRRICTAMGGVALSGPGELRDADADGGDGGGGAGLPGGGRAAAVAQVQRNPIGLQLPIFVELDVAETEPGSRATRRAEA